LAIAVLVDYSESERSVLMIAYPHIDPVALDLGFFQIHWYGLMYLSGFMAGYLIALREAKLGRLALTAEQISDLLFYIVMGIVVGGRLGYGLFYGLEEWKKDLFWIFRIYEGGMSFHGGFLGVSTAVILFASKVGLPLARISDLAALCVPPGLGFGRIGNFIGQELWGRPTDLPWAMVFPADAEALARHPSQLYQAGLEGLALFLIIFIYARQPRPAWSATALFLFCYGIFRFITEFVREPDAHIGFDFLGLLTRGQMLSLPMILIGLALFIWSYQRAAKQA
jgi:phosphatidylglycerol---prolipoprotein diacylglyceryl transferase